MPFAIFPGQYEQLVKIRQFVSDAARQAGLNQKETFAIEQAVDEACSNIIEHAYGGENRGEILCTCCPIESGIKITLQDFGTSFNPDEVAEPDLTKDIQDVKIGGLGLYFIRKLVDEVHFEFTSDRGNFLTLVKRRGELS